MQRYFTFQYKLSTGYKRLMNDVTHFNLVFWHAYPLNIAIQFYIIVVVLKIGYIFIPGPCRVFLHAPE
jgi:putative flippase GtrA